MKDMDVDFQPHSTFHHTLKHSFSHPLTSMLQELAGARDGEEGILQTSEVELQNSSNRVQVKPLLGQGVLSCRGSPQHTAPH